jgi:hypothetical protein
MDTARQPELHREPLRIVAAGGVLAFVGLLASLYPLLMGFGPFGFHGDFTPEPWPSLRDALLEAVVARVGQWQFYAAGALSLALAVALFRGAPWERREQRPVPPRVTAAAGVLAVLAVLALVAGAAAILAASEAGLNPRIAAAWLLAGLGALIVAGLTAWMAAAARSFRRHATWFGPPVALLAGVLGLLSLVIGIDTPPIDMILAAGAIVGLVGVPYVAWALWSTRGPRPMPSTAG